MSQFDEQDVYDTKQLPNKKSVDDMGLSKYQIKTINHTILAHLTDIFSQQKSKAIPVVLKQQSL